MRNGRVVEVDESPQEDEDGNVARPAAIDAELNASVMLYQRGVASDRFTLVLQGEVEVQAGEERFSSSLGPWSFLGSSALHPGLAYVPDYTAYAVGPCRLVQIARHEFLAALKAAQVQTVVGARAIRKVASGAHADTVINGAPSDEGTVEGGGTSVRGRGARGSSKPCHLPTTHTRVPRDPSQPMAHALSQGEHAAVERESGEGTGGAGVFSTPQGASARAAGRAPLSIQLPGGRDAPRTGPTGASPNVGVAVGATPAMPSATRFRLWSATRGAPSAPAEWDTEDGDEGGRLLGGGDGPQPLSDGPGSGERGVGTGRRSSRKGTGSGNGFWGLGSKGAFQAVNGDPDEERGG